MATKEQRPLTAKQRAFCEAYTTTARYSATQAYLQAFNASSETARTSGPKLLKDPRIIAYVHQLQDELVRISAINGSKILKELDSIAMDPDTTKRDRLTALNMMQKQLGLEKTVVNSDNIQITVDIDEHKSDTE